MPLITRRPRFVLLLLLALVLAGCTTENVAKPIPATMPGGAALGTPLVAATPGGAPAQLTATPSIAPHAFTPLCRLVEPYPSAWSNRLHFRGRTYARVVAVLPRANTPESEPPYPPEFALGEEIGRIFAPWQAGNIFDARWYAPTGSPIRTVQGIPSEAMLAVSYGMATDLFCAISATTPLAPTRVVRGRVDRLLPNPYCEFSRCRAGGDVLETHQTIAVTPREVWQGSLPTGHQPLTVITLYATTSGFGAPWLAQGDEVVLVMRPQEAMEDFYPLAISGAPRTGREPVWVAELIGQYRVSGDQLRWVGFDATTIPIAAFRAGLAENFAGVVTTDPAPPLNWPADPNTCTTRATPQVCTQGSINLAQQLGLEQTREIRVNAYGSEFTGRFPARTITDEAEVARIVALLNRPLTMIGIGGSLPYERRVELTFVLATGEQRVLHYLPTSPEGFLDSPDTDTFTFGPVGLADLIIP